MMMCKYKQIDCATEVQNAVGLVEEFLGLLPRVVGITCRDGQSVYRAQSSITYRSDRKKRSGGTEAAGDRVVGQ